MKKEVLSKAAKELDKLLFETSQIKLNQKPEELQKDFEEASKELQSDDEVSDETLEALTEIWKDREGELTVKVCDVFRALGILPAVEENKQEEEAQIVPEDTLVQEINDAERIKDLKDIAKSNDEFKAIRGTLNSFKEMDDLRGEMLAILDGPAEEAPEVKAEAEKEKAAEPAYVKKGNEKKGEPKATMKIVPKDKPEKKAGIKSTMNRSESVMQTIRKLCKKGATMQEIMDESDKVFVEAGGKSNPTATNVNRYSIQALVAFDVLSLNAGKYKLNK